MNKHISLKEWVEQYLDDRKMSFENIDSVVGARALVPQYGEYVTKQDIMGNKYKTYVFGFIAIEQLDTQDVTINNATTMHLIEQFNTWLEEQEESQNFPDFGDNTTNYKIVPLQNMPNMVKVENGMAKYILMARIDYVEKG